MLLRKLENYCSFDPSDRDLLDSTVRSPKRVKAGFDIVREGRRPEHVQLTTSGFAYRYKMLSNGTRQILGYLLPGDLCDLHVSVLDEMDHSIATLSDCSVVALSQDDMQRLLERPAIARALLWATLIEGGIQREALANMGRRKAEHRVGHFLCELLVRLDAIGLVADNTFDIPVTQVDLGDTLGLSSVHINRVLQILRGKELITINRGSVSILDVEGLKAFSGFKPNYLHLGTRRWAPMALMTA